MNVLVVEDDPHCAEVCIEAITKMGHQVRWAPNAQEAEILLSPNTDLVLLDLMLPPDFRKEGLDLFANILRSRPMTPVLFMTAREDAVIDLVRDAIQMGAKTFLDKNKPTFIDELRLEVKKAVEAMSSGVFVSHGQSELIKLKLRTFLSEKIGRAPVILSEQPNQGLTIVEKLERAAEKCSDAIIVLTKDDEQKDGAMRARQNVIHEIGFFQGRYGRNHVILLAETGVELFSNISGIVRIDFSSNHFEECFEPLRTELGSIV